MNTLDDKQMVIIAATILGGMSMFFMQDPATVVSRVISGLFGIAVGRTMEEKVPEVIFPLPSPEGPRDPPGQASGATK